MQQTLIRSLVLCLACAVAPIPALGQAQPPEQPQPAATESIEATESSTERPERRSRFRDDPGEERGDRRGDGREGRGEGRGDGTGFGSGFPPFQPPTAEEWEKAMAFIKEHAPKRWGLHLEQPEPAQQSIRESMFVRFRHLERLRNSDRDIYEIQLRRFALEDEVYSIVSPLFSLSGPRSLNAEEVSRLREKVTAQMDTVLEERELRLQRLRDLLKREEAQLAADKLQRENIIAQRVGFLEMGRGLGRSSGGFSPRFGGMGGPRQDGGGPGMPPPR